MKTYTKEEILKIIDNYHYDLSADCVEDCEKCEAKEDIIDLFRKLK